MDKEQQFRMNFLDEAEDYLDRLESILLELASQVADPQQLDLALRLAHSIKGGAAMMGFTPLSKVAHRLEDFFKILRVRYHSTSIGNDVETLLLQGIDHLRQIVGLHRQGIEIEQAWLANHVNPIFEQLRQHLGELQIEDENALLAQDEEVDPALLIFEEGVEAILDRFEIQLEDSTSSQLSQELAMTAEELTAFGRMANLEPFIQLCESIRQESAIASNGQIESLARRALTLWRRSHGLVLRSQFEKLPSHLEGIESTELQVIDALETLDLADLQAAFAVEMPAEIPSSELNLKSTPKKNSDRVGKTIRVPVEQFKQFNTLFGNLIIERNAINLRLDQLRNFAELMRLRMQRLEQSNTQLRRWYDQASLEGIVPMSASQVSGDPLTIPRKTHEQFDTLEMDRYTDLHVISQEHIETIVQLQEVRADIELGLQEMNHALRDFNQTTKSMQENVTRTQMLPFADVVKPFPRVVRDLCLQFGKQVNLKIEGEATLIDRLVLETLRDPLIHLLRNAFDHGIEDPATRIALGKPKEGTITLQAINRGTQTVITIRDDGAGIRPEKIRDRLRSMGIPQEQIEQMSEAEILDYIFEPGFSTADRVTELSGRGVGMDVVRTNLRDIRTDIKVQTQRDRGTTFILSVPFTLSILRVMLLERAGIIFAVSVESVREILPLQPKQISFIEGVEQSIWNKQIIPIVRLEESLRFRRPGKPFEMPVQPVINQPTVLIVGEGTTFAGIHIDRFWGEQEVTIRPIESPLPLPPGFISSIVLGDGRVIPLVAPLQLIEGFLQGDRELNQPEFPPSNKDLLPLTQNNTILVVDDSINVRNYLTLMLQKAGYQVEQAKDGQEAVDKLFGGLSVQAVICDIEMPRLDGYGVLEEVKAKPQFQDLPIIMLTSRTNEKHRKLAMNLGASDYFSKPYNEQQLLQKLAQLQGISKPKEILSQF